MGDIYLIPDREHIKDSLEITEQYGAFFEYNDFYAPEVLEDKGEIRKRIAFYRDLGRDCSKDTLHGAFLDVTLHSDDPAIREISMKRIRQSMDIAEELGVRGVVFHTNTIPNFRSGFYLENWLERNERFWRQMLREYPKLWIFMENMFDETPELLEQLAVRMQDETRFGLCFDYAHACVFGDGIAEWAKRLCPHTRHMHINDNDLAADLHQSVGSGRIDWQQYDRLMREYAADCSVLVEVRSAQGQRESIEYLKKNRFYPF